MTREMHLLGESIQEITLCAWPIVWDGNKYDQDSRVVLEMLREWAEEFETWYESHLEDDDWMAGHDYISEAWAFADRKSKEYISQFED